MGHAVSRDTIGVVWCLMGLGGMSASGRVLRNDAFASSGACEGCRTDVFSARAPMGHCLRHHHSRSPMAQVVGVSTFGRSCDALTHHSIAVILVVLPGCSPIAGRDGPCATHPVATC